MPRSKTLQAAEKKAVEGNNESQDSQAIFDRYVAEYGIGVVRTAIFAFSRVAFPPQSGGVFSACPEHVWWLCWWAMDWIGLD